MWCNQTFSIVKPELQSDETTKQIVVNVIVCDNYEVANNVAKAVFGETSYALETTDYAISIGYEYKDGLFYKTNGEVVESSKSLERQQLEDLIVLIADMVGGAI